mmetsp:Transcript_6019/g.12721  ORF Transcript_6019/g.12721 Transcript_6019/m.12721 type:complete len:124 (+) Transcript_6019:461-832(+)
MFVLGRSIGTGIAVKLSTSRCPAGVFLVSPFTSIKDVVVNIVGSCLAVLCKQRFDSFGNSRNPKTKYLVLHGDKDELIPSSQGQKLSERLCGKFELLENQTHNRMDNNLIVNKIREFMDNNHL